MAPLACAGARPAAEVTETAGPGRRPARPPESQTYAHPDGTTHLLLRFDGFVHNRGTGAFEMRGSRPAGGRMSATAQRIYRSNGTWFDDTSRDLQMIWEPEDGHDHWHLKNAARYSLWSSDQTAEVAPAMKVGFCLIDSQHVETHGPAQRVYTTPRNNFCGQGAASALPSLVEGVSAGWRDVYVARSRSSGWTSPTSSRASTGCAPRSTPTTGCARATR